MFDLGQIVATRSIVDNIKADVLTNIINRHQHGDWGTLCKADKKLNDEAVKTGEDHILSKYEVRGETIYVITEWDRSVTTVLYASEY